VYIKQRKKGFFMDDKSQIFDKYKDDVDIKNIQNILDNLLDDSDIGIFLLSSDFQIIWISSAIENLFGLKKEDAIGKDKKALIKTKIKYIFEDGDYFEDNVLKTYQDNTYVENFECKIKNSSKWLRHFSYPITSGFLKGGRIETYFDITPLKEAQKNLKSSYEKFKVVNDAAQDAIVMMDDKGNISYWNRSAEKIFGYSKDEALGKHLHTLLAPERFREQYNRGFKLFSELGDGPDIGRTVELVAKKKDGREFPIELSLSAIRLNNEWNAIGIVRDISDYSKMKEKVHFLSHYDPITGLPNRQFFMDILSSIIDKLDTRELMALAVINPIKFTYINQVYGFESGNSILVQISERIRQFLKSRDIVARLETAQFAIILKNVKDENSVINVLLRLIEHLEKPYSINNKEVYIEFSAGVKFILQDTKDTDVVLNQANAALSKAKDSSMKLAFYRQEFEKEIQKRLDIRNDIKNALQNGEFILYYQPYFDVKTKKVAGAEALLRWKKDGKIVPPMDFIPYLEESGMIRDVERWIMDEVSKKVSYLVGAGFQNIPISINISPTSFNDDTLSFKFADIIKKYNIPKGMINIEIVERLFLNNIERSIDILNSLRKAGVGFSIDDFGTGYSSLSYLAKLPVDCVKIDISFVRAMLTDYKTMSIVDTIIYMSKKLGLKTVAEGVEEKKQFDKLKDIGCDYIQGYFLAKPMSFLEFDKLLNIS
jgi:PAS domain S-box-containing protein/diguanylate cyclase (GGDEF)-like protein